MTTKLLLVLWVAITAAYPVLHDSHDRTEQPSQPLRRKVAHLADTLHFDELLKVHEAPRARGKESEASSAGTVVNKELIHQLATDAPTALNIGSIGTLAT